jgi:hypothetical protein
MTLYAKGMIISIIFISIAMIIINMNEPDKAPDLSTGQVEAFKPAWPIQTCVQRTDPSGRIWPEGITEVCTTVEEQHDY